MRMMHFDVEPLKKPGRPSEDATFRQHENRFGANSSLRSSVTKITPRS
jgi:hypothetical protein